jgi:phosphoacetylglucosamine mutase
MSGHVLLANRILEIAKQHSRQNNTFIDYGTAGFRNKAYLLDHVIFRMGIVAALRSKATKSTIGVMITASHNPEEDNGVKLIDPKGEMLVNHWEQLATKVANAEDGDLEQVLNELIKNENIDLDAGYPSQVFIGRDTRKSSPGFSKSLIDGIKCLTNDVTDFGEVSTPIVHYAVVCRNTDEKYGQPTTRGYYSKLSSAFNAIVALNPENGSRKNKLVRIDAANGVGAPVLQKTLQGVSVEALSVDLLNDGSKGILNFECGADYVKTTQKEPVNFPIEKGVRCASFDGDADRIIYFYFDEQNNFHMLDGDKIAVLMADHLGDLVKRSGLALNLGLIQTAYANGNSTNYITKNLGLPVTCCLTGVKHLHHAAQHYDIGVYFEANGHGTVTFSDSAIDLIEAAAGGGDASSKAALELSHFTKLINSTVGDAISDMLTVEAILHSKGWNIQDWDALYKELPNRLLKVQVADRSVISTTDAERICTAPKGVQQRIDELVAKYPNGRSFIRPSGTEDVVRVYAEADTQANTDELANAVAGIVYDLCNGVGERPT